MWAVVPQTTDLEVTHDRGQAPGPTSSTRMPPWRQVQNATSSSETDALIRAWASETDRFDHEQAKDIITPTSSVETGLNLVASNHKGGCIGPTSLAEDHSGDEKSYQLSAYN